MFARMRRRWRPLLALVLVAILATVAGAAVAVLSSQPGDVSNPDVEFEAEDTPTTTPREPAEPGETTEKGLINWPEYGLNPQRTKFLPLAEPLRPPFTFTWAVRGSILLEFPPVAGGRQLFLLKNNAALYGISRRTGEVRWKRKLGYLAASSPAYAKGTVYVTLLQRGKGVRAGRVVAINAADGRTKWSRKLASRSESSPVYENGNLYFGAEDGTVYNLRASDGFVRWRYRAGGAVKAALAMDRGRLFFGDYDGKMHAIRASNGKKLWVKGTEGARFGLSSGNFYSTPAVAYGRVYIGNTDGNVYSFGAKDGALAWRKKTDGYVYSSPALAYSTVYIGSYDKKLYALDAQSGRVKWARRTSARISGGPVVLGDLVFVSNLGKRTYAFGARTGQKVWETNKGAFNPAIGDGERIYLVGYSSLFAMKPRADAVRAPAGGVQTPARPGAGAARAVPEEPVRAARAQALRPGRPAALPRAQARRPGRLAGARHQALALPPARAAALMRPRSPDVHDETSGPCRTTCSECPRFRPSSAVSPRTSRARVSAPAPRCTWRGTRSPRTPSGSCGCAGPRRWRAGARRPGSPRRSSAGSSSAAAPAATCRSASCAPAASPAGRCRSTRRGARSGPASTSPAAA